MDFQNNNNYVSRPKRNKVWLDLPSIPTNCKTHREPLPGASSLMVTDDWHFGANKMSPSCLNNRVLKPLLLFCNFYSKKHWIHPAILQVSVWMDTETPTVNLQFSSISLSNYVPLHLNKPSHKVRLLHFFNPLFMEDGDILVSIS